SLPLSSMLHSTTTGATKTRVFSAQHIPEALPQGALPPAGVRPGYWALVQPLVWRSSPPTTGTRTPVHACLDLTSGRPPSWRSTRPPALGSGDSSRALTRSGTTTAHGGKPW